MRRFSKHNLAVLASMTLALSLSTAGSAKLLGLPGLPMKSKPEVTQKALPESKTTPKAAKTPPAVVAPIISERLKAAAQNLLAARKQVDIARAQLKAAEAEYKVAKIEREAIALRQAAQGMATQNMAVAAGSKAEPTTSMAQRQMSTERIEAPQSSPLGDLMPEPAVSKPTMAPAPGWNMPAAQEPSIDDLDLP